MPADDFIARSSDELSLAKGDRVELIERDDEFGDGWFLGRHMVNGNSGLFPEGKAQIISMELFRLQAQSVRVKRDLTLLCSLYSAVPEGCFSYNDRTQVRAGTCDCACSSGEHKWHFDTNQSDPVSGIIWRWPTRDIQHDNLIQG